jgi:hypothetical protein
VRARATPGVDDGVLRPKVELRENAGVLDGAMVGVSSAVPVVFSGLAIADLALSIDDRVRVCCTRHDRVR